MGAPTWPPHPQRSSAAGKAVVRLDPLYELPGAGPNVMMSVGRTLKSTRTSPAGSRNGYGVMPKYRWAVSSMCFVAS